MANLATSRASYAQYLADEELSEVKHEFCEGAVVAMAGGTPEHSRLKTNLAALVSVQLAGKPCSSFDSDLRVRVPETTLATYPDLTVICGPFIRDNEDRNAAVNPTALFEVLSAGTAAYDRGEKFDHYMRLPTLRVYVLVDHTRPHVDVYTRNVDETWTRRGFGPGSTFALEAIGAELAVDAIYAGWAELRP